MKKLSKRIIVTICMLTCACSTFLGCGNPQHNNPMPEIDKTKTQLYVGVFDGGYGTRWLEEYKKGFEELYKDQSFESGKMGVELVPLADKISYSASSLENSMDRSAVNVFFSELVNYYKFVEDGLLMDISDVVTDPLPNENKTIESKLNASQKQYYNIDGKYYGLPHYRSFRGIVYDKDLFNKKKLYIKADGNVAGKEGDTDLSKGPDGVSGTYDDGLPATYDEFFAWCDTVKTDKGITPIVWNGANKESYTKHLQDALFADSLGADAANAYYNIPESGAAKTLPVVTGFDGSKPIITDTQVSRDNYKLITQLSGNYYALDFLQRIISGNYYYSLSMNSTFSHEETHYDFLHSRFDPEMQEIAMMVEGTWWEEESDGIFEGMSDYEGASRAERKFGFLPLPKPTEDYLGAPTLFDGNKSIVMVNANCDAVHTDLAKKFIQYISTDASLQKFNTITGIGRDYKYTLTDTQQDELTTFATDIYNLVQSGKGIVYGYATNYSAYTWGKTHTYDRFTSKLNSSVEIEPILAFAGGKTAKDYFEGIIENNK